MKIKESEKTEKNMDIAKELKKLWNMRVTMVLQFVHLEWFLRSWKEDGWNWKSEEELGPSTPQHC